MVLSRFYPISRLVNLRLFQSSPSGPSPSLVLHPTSRPVAFMLSSHSITNPYPYPCLSSHLNPTTSGQIGSTISPIGLDPRGMLNWVGHSGKYDLNASHVRGVEELGNPPLSRLIYLSPHPHPHPSVSKLTYLAPLYHHITPLTRNI